jgi:osmotically-inducible protein OsmY
VTIGTLTSTDIRVRDAVAKELEGDPRVDASAVASVVKNGAVTLTGFVDTYAAKLAAERAAKRVHGVREVANDIEVRLRLARTDADIALDAAKTLELRDDLPDSIQAAVHDGHLTLTGTVAWLFQKENAAKAMRHVRGVRHVIDHITVQPIGMGADVRQLVLQNLQRSADVDARHVTVSVSGDTVILQGTVDTWLQREAAERTAANAPGAAKVDNQLMVQSFHDYKMDFDDQC